MEAVGRNLAASPSDLGFLRLGLLLRAKGNEQDASSILERAIAKNPDYVNSRELLDFLRGALTATKQTQ